MKITNKNSSSYSEQTANDYINPKVPVKCATSTIETIFDYQDGKRTENVKGYRLWFVQEGLNPFTVKFETQPVLPEFLALVKFDNLQGIEIRNNVYFKADGISEVK